MKLSELFLGFAYKKLVPVDLPGLGSHQHEINGSRALAELFGTTGRVKGQILWLYFGPNEEIEKGESDFTWYDAREKSSARTGRTEWRFYYTGNFLNRANVGDALLIIKRKPSGVNGVIFSKNSVQFENLCQFLGLTDLPDSMKVLGIDSLRDMDAPDRTNANSNLIEIISSKPGSADNLRLLTPSENNQRSESLPFKPRARMLLLLGDQLIRDAGIAVFELVKNAYDADATKVAVNLWNVSNKQEGNIVVEDDGTGMEWDQIINVWLEPGTDYRQQQKLAGNRSPLFHRLPLGEKGVGRFAVHKLGKIIKLITRKVNCPEVVVDINWNSFFTEKYLSEANVKVSEREPQYFTGQRTGTRIEIYDLNEEFSRGTVRQVFRAVNSICSPFSSPNEFRAEVNVQPPDNSLVGLLTLPHVLELAPYRATCLVDNDFLIYDYDFVPPPNMDRIEGRKVRDRRMPLPTADLFSKDEFQKSIGRLLLDFRIFDLDTYTLQFAVQDKKGFRDFLRSNGGVRVYRDGVRVYDYGEPGNDWLDLDEDRVNQPTGRISNNQFIGAIHLDGATSTGLIEKTNREGFIEDSVFLLFKSIVKFAVKQVVVERNMDKDRIRTIYANKTLKEPVIAQLTELRVQLQRHPNIAGALIPLVDGVEHQYREMRDTLLTAAGAGLTLSVMVHEVQKAIKNLSTAVVRDAPLKELRNLASHLNELIEGLTYLTRKSGRRNETFLDLVRQTLLNTNYRTQAHGVTVINGLEAGDPNISVRCTRRLIIATLMNLIDNSIYWLSTKSSEDQRIYIGSNADLSGGPVLYIADNGPGFQDPPEMLVQPFMSRRPEGMGIGLHIASEVMKAHEGRVIFPSAEDLGIERTYTGAIVGLQFKE